MIWLAERSSNDGWQVFGVGSPSSFFFFTTLATSGSDNDSSGLILELACYTCFSSTLAFRPT